MDINMIFFRAFHILIGILIGWPLAFFVFYVFRGRLEALFDTTEEENE